MGGKQLMDETFEQLVGLAYEAGADAAHWPTFLAASYDDVQCLDEPCQGMIVEKLTAQARARPSPPAAIDRDTPRSARD